MTLTESLLLVVGGVLLIGAGWAARRVVQNIEYDLAQEKRQRERLAELRGETPDDQTKQS